MKIYIRNKSNKKRSKKSIKELRYFIIYIAKEFNITESVKEIHVNFMKDFNGYFPKNKPFGGFLKLFKDGKVQIDLARFWDYSRLDNRRGIVHELTHVKQMVEGRLVVHNDMKGVHWNGEENHTWRMFRFKKASQLDEQDFKKYIAKYFPWEREVQINEYKYT